MSVRYIAFITPREKVDLAARQAGWKGSSDSKVPSDFVDPESFETPVVFAEFHAAKDFASSALEAGKDYYGQCYIYRETYLLNWTTRRQEWIRDYKWIISESGLTDYEAPVERER